MSPENELALDVHTGVHSESRRGSGVLALLRVVLVLTLWVCAFVAFLVAPLLVLILAWIVGVAWIAYRQRGKTTHPELVSGPPVGAAHAFGASFSGRGDTDGDHA